MPQAARKGKTSNCSSSISSCSRRLLATSVRKWPWRKQWRGPSRPLLVLQWLPTSNRLGPVSLLDIQGAGEAGNVTVRVDIFSQNASEIHEVIEALERRLKATFISDFAAAIRWRSQEYATAGHLRMSALVGSLDSAVIGDVANTTAETIHDVLGNVVTDIQKVQIAGLPNVSGEGLPIHAPSPADEAKAPSTGRPPTEEAEEAEASSLSTPQAHGSVRGPWSFVGLVGIAVLGVLGLLLVIVNRCTG